MAGIVVVGGGQAGASLVAKLRALGYDGDLTLFCEEPVLPYQRPPLSKKYLLGDFELERLFLRPRKFYDEQRIDLRIGQPVTAIDRGGKTVTAGGVSVPYDALALTTGSRPHRLPSAIGGDLGGVHVVRSLADVDKMAPDLKAGHVLVVGGGYIGLEAAAVAAGKGLKVTLVELADRILKRVAAPVTSDFFRALHLSHGVEIRESTGLDRLIGTDRVTGAVLSDGSEIDVDNVIVGVGIAPDTRLAASAGLDVDNGIKVDELGRTSDPAIWAAGDCTSFPFNNGRQRLESVQNAIDQAECVAANMLGDSIPYIPQPWFWSDQFDVKLQIAGLNAGYDHVVVRVGEAAGSVSHWYFLQDRLLAVDAINDPRAYMVGKRLIEMKKSPSPAEIANSDTNLKALLKA
jgi:3-phenylpropionate/trans-cinnamate dioxygenase ferredoxin reductase subunit